MVKKNAYLLEQTRYVVLNPGARRHGTLTPRLAQSNYRAMIGLDAPPEELQTDALLALLGKNRASPQKQYAHFVAEGIDETSPWEHLKGQIYLGNEEFVKPHAN